MLMMMRIVPLALAAVAAAAAAAAAAVPLQPPNEMGPHAKVPPYVRVPPGAAGHTALDAYIAAPDPAYKWVLNSTFRSELLAYTAYNLRLTSQHWLEPSTSTAYTWEHWVTVCVPDYVDPATASDQAFLWIDGDDVTSPAPKSFVGSYLATEAVCVDNKAISAMVLGIPNEPVWFAADPKHQRRTEDAIIAYTWAHYLNNTKEPNYLLRLPMVKATVMAMNAIQEFSTQHLADKLPHGPPKEFVTAGASKRGWVTWLTGAVDKRVKAMIPIVMPILDVTNNINYQVRAYGDWSFALDDYLAEGLMGQINNPKFQQLCDIVDPYHYISRLTMPKLVMTAAGDEFFLPDSPRFFYDKLIGDKWLTVIPDAEHSLITAYRDVADTVTSFYYMIKHPGIPRPNMSWKINYSNTTASTVLETEGALGLAPISVTKWYARTLSQTMRDFRLVVCGQLPECINPVIWWAEDLTSTPIAGSSRVHWNATMTPPSEGGWNGFIVTATYQLQDSPRLMKLSTQVNIVPDRWPFPFCYELGPDPAKCCQSPKSCEKFPEYEKLYNKAFGH